jgi:regulator of RNase E activity RraA
VYARSVTPIAGGARELRDTQIVVECGGVRIAPGDLLFGDDDGIVVGTESELTRLLRDAERIHNRERRVIAAMQRGESLFAWLNFQVHASSLGEGRESRLELLE